MYTCRKSDVGYLNFSSEFTKKTQLSKVNLDFSIKKEKIQKFCLFVFRMYVLSFMAFENQYLIDVIL